MPEVLFDAAGRRRSPRDDAGFHAGRPASSRFSSHNAIAAPAGARTRTWFDGAVARATLLEACHREGALAAASASRGHCSALTRPTSCPPRP
jgi:hypothetical protein